MAAEASAQRLDKWLWYSRFFKTRSLSSKLVASGKVRVNSEAVSKASHQVRPGDVLTFPQARDIRVIRIDALGERRGPATEAAELYTDLSPVEKKGTDVPENPKFEGKGRPTKKDRRQIDPFGRTRLD